MSDGRERRRVPTNHRKFPMGRTGESAIVIEATGVIVGQ
jgi:hypothetical protein